MSDADAITVREFESIIDAGYRSLPIFKYPVDVALYGLLAAQDSHIYTQMMVREHRDWAHLSVGQMQMFKTLSEGLVWAVRWLLDGREVIDVRPQASEELITTAAQLIDYGWKYENVALMYSAYSHGNMKAVVDGDARRVRFDYIPQYSGAVPNWAFYDDISNQFGRRTPSQERQHDVYRRRACAVFRQARHHFTDGRVVIDDVAKLSMREVRDYVESACESDDVFAADEDLGGYTIRDFTRLWHALYAWSICTTELYLRFTETETPQQECMPTQVVPKEAFVNAIAGISGLPHGVVARIAKQLEYDRRTSKPDVFLQPLICGRTTVAWSAMIVQLSKFQRNLLKVMARTPSQKCVADRIIGDRERDLLASLKSWLENKGWAVGINRKLSQGQGEVDLLAVNWRTPSEVLIVEAKALLQVDDSNERRSATKEMQHGQEQVRKIVQLLSRMTPEEKSRLFSFVEWDKVRHWYGIVVTPETEPGTEFDHSAIPAAAFLTLRQRLGPKAWTSPSRIWSAMVDREWQSPVREATLSHHSITLAGITFEIPELIFQE